MAILKAKINVSKFFTVALNDVQLLEDIIIAGFPLGKEVSANVKVTKGRCHLWQDLVTIHLTFRLMRL